MIEENWDDLESEDYDGYYNRPFINHFNDISHKWELKEIKNISRKEFIENEILNRLDWFSFNEDDIEDLKESINNYFDKWKIDFKDSQKYTNKYTNKLKIK